MLKKIIDTLNYHQRAGNLLALLLVSVTSLALIAIRFYFAMPSRAYVFLVWNLFLAWIPYLIGLLLFLCRQHIKSAWQLWIIILWWLLFFPNAPYIITDFFHFGQKPYIPVWFDLIVLFSFAWSGLFLTLLSLRDVHIVIAQRYGRGWGWLFAAGTILFGALGVYTGRYLRWNSWDVFIDPGELLSDVANRLIYPSQDWRAWGLTLAFSFFLSSAYTTLLLLTREQSTTGSK